MNSENISTETLSPDELERVEFLLKQFEVRHLLSSSPPTATTPIKMASVVITFPLGSFRYWEVEIPVKNIQRKEYTREQVLMLIHTAIKKILT